MVNTDRQSWRGRAAPALLLAFLAPIFAEVLPGATRFSSIFVFPIEMAVWGGGAVMIRDFVRRLGLGWGSLFLLGLAFAVAEECLIQQTSLAPLVIKLKGVEWGRDFGVNYVYLIWALIYESVWVVLLPVLAAEQIFPERRSDAWLSRSGAVVTAGLFLAGAGLAWFSWTQIARVQVFHQPAYRPPALAVAAAMAAIALLGWAALGLPRRRRMTGWHPPGPWLVAMAAGLWAILWYGLVVLAFGMAPWIPPAWVVAGALILIAALLVVVPRLAAHSDWGARQDFAVVAGALSGSMAISFVGFIGSATADLIFKILADLLACLFLLWLGARVSGTGARLR